MALLIATAVPAFNAYGTHALLALRKACEISIQNDQANAVFYRLLADHADRLIDDYHQVPLATSKAAEDFRHLKEMIAIAEGAVGQSTALKFEAANAIASMPCY
jgi:hypothetical protein